VYVEQSEESERRKVTTRDTGSRAGKVESEQREEEEEEEEEERL